MDEGVLHHLGQRAGGAARALLASRLGSLPLNDGELRRKIVELGHFAVEALVARDDAVGLLVLGQACLRLLQVFAQRFVLLAEPARILPRRVGPQLDAGFDIGLREGVGHGGGEGRVDRAERDVDDVALARGLDAQLFLQSFRQPGHEAALALGLLQPLFLLARRLIELEQLHHRLCHAIAADDVALRGHVARHHHRVEHGSSDRIRRIHVDHHRRRCGVFLGQHQARRHDRRYGREQDQHDDLEPCAQNRQELVQAHCVPGFRSR